LLGQFSDLNWILWTLVHRGGHFIASLVLGLLFYYVTGNIPASFICFLAGFMIDIDHVLDYYLIYGKLDIGRTLKGCFHKDRVYVFLHSWELLIVLFYFNVYTIAFAIGFGTHLIMDALANGLENKYMGYFLSYRIAKDFKVLRL